MVSNAGFVVIGQDAPSKAFWVQKRDDNNGKPGLANFFGDGIGDVRPMINNYIQEGYDPEKIIYNGQPVTDVFTKTTDENGNVAFKGVQKSSANVADRIPARQVVTLSNGEELVIPVMMGSSTNVEPLVDGTYKVTSQAIVFPKPEPKVTIMTEEELVAKFKPNMNNRIEPKA